MALSNLGPQRTGILPHLDHDRVHSQHGHVPCLWWPRHRHDCGDHDRSHHHIRHHERLLCDGELFVATLLALRVHALVCRSRCARRLVAQELELGLTHTQQLDHAHFARVRIGLYCVQNRHVQSLSDRVQVARGQERKPQVAASQRRSLFLIYTFSLDLSFFNSQNRIRSFYFLILF